jgi:hypothetical protein
MDYAYWAAVLKAEGLGMNRGTTFPEEDKLAKLEEGANQNKIKNKGGQPRKPRPPQGPRPNLNKKESLLATRFTMTEPSGVFQNGGFRTYGPSVPYGAGKGQKGGRRGSDVSGAFIQYVGDNKDLARIEESQARQESGRVIPSGYGPDR